ncbi:hypothetical protein T4D_7903, partial [Trichinella pseudospiralis]
MDSRAHQALPDWLHLDGRRRKALSLRGLLLQFSRGPSPRRALDSCLFQEKGEERHRGDLLIRHVLHERSPGFQSVWRQLSLYHREERVETAQLCVHVLPEGSQFEE